MHTQEHKHKHTQKYACVFIYVSFFVCVCVCSLVCKSFWVYAYVNTFQNYRHRYTVKFNKPKTSFRVKVIRTMEAAQKQKQKMH